MQEFSKVKKLDDILIYLNNASVPKSINSIILDINNNQYIKLTLDELRIALKKLDKDEHIHSSVGNDVFTISWEGSLFIELGGYSAKISRDAFYDEQQQLEINRLRSVDASGDQNQKTLNKLTGRLVLATWFAFAAALALLIWQVVQYFLEHDC